VASASLLRGIKVIDWTQGQQGPLAAALLGDLGADVIHVEPPVTGEMGRGFLKAAGIVATMAEGRNFYFEANNRNKRGITVDLKKDRGREIIYRLIEKSDVFIHNMRKGVAEKLGLDYETLSRRNPRLIYAWASGFGPVGPDSERPGLDFTGQGQSGIMYGAGFPDMPPLPLASGMCDQMGAIILSWGILAALVARERLGVGQQVNTSLLGGVLALQGLNVNQRLWLGQKQERTDRAKARNPLWNYYQCRDGKWLILAMMGEHYWPLFCKTVGLEDLIARPVFESMEKREQNCEELVSILDDLFAGKSREEWIGILNTERDLIYSVVNDMDDVVRDPQVTANRYIVDFDHPVFGPIKYFGFPVHFSETPMAIQREAPELGQHTEEVLLEVGYNWEDIGLMKDEGVI
jgi:crotonobetainyl-CoA:carnitine CoA-transferase CaiB-like acyl-CoA transferase